MFLLICLLMSLLYGMDNGYQNSPGALQQVNTMQNQTIYMCGIYAYTLLVTVI